MEGESKMEKEVKVVVLNDEDGNEFELEVAEEFEFKGSKYAVLFEECDHEHDGEEDHEDNLYLFEVKEEDGKEMYFEITDEAKMQELLPVVEKMLFGDEKASE